MKQRLLAALLTVAVFAAGYGARAWTESDRPLPPPPGKVGDEFAQKAPAQDKAGSGRGGPRPVDRAKLAAQIEQLGPQIAAYRENVAKIEMDFDNAYLAILSPEQRAQVEKQRLGRQQQREVGRGEQKSKEPGPADVLTDDQINQLLFESPMTTLASKMIVPMRLEMIERSTPLDAGQKAKMIAALKLRRDQYEDLVDSVPPPSIMLSRIAQDAQRLGVKSAPKPPTQPAADAAVAK